MKITQLLEAIREGIKDRDLINTKKAVNEAMSQLSESITSVYKDDLASGYITEGEYDGDEEDVNEEFEEVEVKDEEEVEESKSKDDKEDEDDKDKKTPLEEFLVKQFKRKISVKKITEEDEEDDEEEDKKDKDSLNENPLVGAVAGAVAGKVIDKVKEEKEEVEVEDEEEIEEGCKPKSASSRALKGLKLKEADNSADTGDDEEDKKDEDNRMPTTNKASRTNGVAGQKRK